MSPGGAASGGVAILWDKAFDWEQLVGVKLAWQNHRKPHWQGTSRAV